VVLDASDHAGNPWRMRWDSLRLFTPVRLDHLDGMNFPGPSSQVPTKDEFADYLAAYVQQFELPVRHGTAALSAMRVGPGAGFGQRRWGDGCGP
jgi:putative flavoprotein involved in K+ transport